MQSVDFLGGRYEQSEQILPGPVQTFRAQELSTGRPVFVHRMSTAEDTSQQISLLRLLSLALLRSASARGLVLDFSDEGGFWYVVTQSDHRCLLLREWLQFEIDEAAGQGDGPVKRETVELEMPTTAAPVEQAPAKPELPPAVTTKIELPKPAPSQTEPGEFTRFFQEGLPAAKKSPRPEPARGRTQASNPDLLRTQDRPARISGFVQRPNTPIPQSNTPIPQPPQRSSEPGEFTKIFSRSATEAASNTAPSHAPGSAPSGTLLPGSSDPVSGGFSGTAGFGTGSSPLGSLPDVRSNKVDLPSVFSTAQGSLTPTPSAPKEPGEYTRIFGKGSVPPAQHSRVVTQQLPTLDGSLTAGAPRTPVAAPHPVAKGPSEYTQVMQGSKSQDPSAAEAGIGGIASRGGIPPLPAPNLTIPKPNLPGGVSIAAPAIPQPQALPQAPATAVLGNNKKLIVFLSILGALAVLLIILVVIKK